MKEKILITLATGRTGFATTLNLLRDGYQVRIFVRSRNERALELMRYGAEIVLGQFNKYDDWQVALQGVQRVYFNYPITKGMPGSVQFFIKAATAAGIEAVVFMGQWLAEFDNQQSLLTNDIKTSYKLLHESGLPVIYFNPGFFADNNLALTESIVQLGRMPSAYGNGKYPWISTGDMARVVAALLKNPQLYIGQKIHPTGPESIDATEMATIYSRITGRKVKVMPVSGKLFMKAVLAAADEFGYNTFIASQTVLYLQEFRANTFAVGGSTDIVKKLTGREPESFETIARHFIEQSPYRVRSFSNRLHAIKNLFRIIFQKLPGKQQLEALNQYP